MDKFIYVEDAAMVKWEYKLVQGSRGQAGSMPGLVLTDLSAAGEEGWEAVGVSANGHTPFITVLLKRKKQDKEV